MIQQAAPIIATALLYSLYAGTICYIVIQVLLLLFKNMRSFYKYHMVNMGLLATFIVFLLPLKDIQLQQTPAPAISVTTPTAVNTDVANEPMEATPIEAAADTSTADVLWVLNNYILQHSDVIMLMYLIGLLLFSMRLLMQYISLVRLRTKGILPADSQWEQLLGSVQERLHIKANIRLAFTEREISPCIIGHAKAMILIPISIVNNLTIEQAEAILLHELAHYKQYDHYINIANQCIKCILFFNPFVWLLSKMADKYRELSCDETATAHERNIELAETLALIAGMHTRQNSLTLNLKKPSTLLTRIQALLQMKEEPKATNRTTVFTMMTIVLTAGMLLFSNTQLFSSDKDELRAQLQEISATMYKEGNHKYIVVDAVLDSLITLPAKPDVLYMGGDVLYVNGQQIPTELVSRYTVKLNRFLAQIKEHEGSVLDYKYIGKEPLMIEDILNVNSSFRQLTNKDKYEAGINTPAWRKLFRELYKDGLIKKMNDTFSLDYGPNGIVVNSTKLENATADKYVRIFEEEVGLNTNKISGSLTHYDLQKYFDTTEPTGKVSEQGEWEHISLLLFKNADVDYIIVDAIKDGFLEDGENLTVVFTDSTVVFKGENFTPEVQHEYNDKYKTFVGYHSNLHCYGAISKTVNYADIKDPNSYFRNESFLLKERTEKHSKFLSAMYKELQKDKLIDTNYSCNIRYKGSTHVEVNYKPLEGDILTKYSTLFKKNMPQVADGSWESYSLTWNGNKPYANIGLSEKNMLKILSDSLFAEGNQRYTIVDAIIDGYIHPLEKFRINYNKDNFSILGKDMTADKKKAYETKYAKFRKHHDDKEQFLSAIYTTREGDFADRSFIEQVATFLHMPNYKPSPPKGNRTGKAVEKLDYNGIDYTGTPYIKVKGDTAHVSSTGAMTYYNHENSKEMKANMKKLVASMHDDKLLDSNSYYKIEYQYDGVYVNAKQLTGTMGNRYIAMLNSFGYKPGKGHILERHPEGVAIEDTKIGKYIIQMNTHGNNLPAIADKMFTEGNADFILAHALNDGVIKPRKHYNIMYDHGVMTSDGKVMPEPYQSKYSKLMQDFFKAHKQSTYNYSTRGDGVTAKDFNDLNSTIRKNKVDDKRYIDGTYYVDHVIGLMAKDKLIDTNAAYEMKYNWNGLKVNGNKLTERQAAKYTAILERGMGHKPKFPDDAIIVTN